jgi:HEAT repeat protein/Flp pilus assembly protein TadD
MGLLAHQDPQLRSEAASSLGHIGDPESIPFLIEALVREKQDEQVPLALAEIGNQSALQPLLDAFQQSDRYARPNIAFALGAFRDPKVSAALIQGLGDPDPNVRFQAVSAIGKLKDASLVSNLLACLGEANEWIFLNVVEVLSRLADHRATNPMIAYYLKEPNERKRAALVTALGFLKDLTSLTTITKALKDPDDRVKANAVEAIRRLGLPKDKALNLLQPFMKHPDNRVRGNAIVAIAELGNTDLGHILETMRDDPDKWNRATLGYVLSVVPFPKALPMIVDLLKDEDGDVRKNAARALAVRARDEETEILIKLLNDQTPFVRLQAVQTLGKNRTHAAVPGLSRLFSHERNFRIRSAIVAALGNMGDPEGSPTLQQGLQDLDSRVRANSVEALEKVLADKANDLIRRHLNDPDNRTRANAAKALFRNGDTSVLADLESMLTDKENSTRVSGAYALGQIGLALRELERSPLFHSLKAKLSTVPLKDLAVERERVEAAHPAGTPAERQAVGDREQWRETFVEHYRQGRYKESLHGVMEFLRKFPGDLNANLFAGNLHSQLSQFDHAARYYKTVVDLDPVHIQALGNMAIACFKGNRVQEAIHYFKQALQIQPDLATLRFNLANLLLRESHWEDAITHYLEGMRHQKPPARVLANLGFAYQKTGNYEKALQQYQAAVEADPKEPGVYYNLALILYRQGQKDSAKTVLQKALKEVPPNSSGLKSIREFIERLKSE